MSEIQSFPFKKEDFGNIKNSHFGHNWPVVYLIENGIEAYIGETTSAYTRARQHVENEQRKKLKTIHLIGDSEYNKSATLDIESWLIQYLSADGKFKLQNGNGGLQNHNYYDKEKYKAKFDIIWEELRKKSLVQKDLQEIKNSDLFKYSPYKALTEDQLVVAEQIVAKIVKNNHGAHIIHGGPGTGKTILAVYLVKYLLEKEDLKNKRIALVVPMTSLRSTIKKVFSHVSGLKSAMVIGPGDVVKNTYDILIVDEAHRLQQRKNITNFKSFDDTNKKLGLSKEGTQLEWIIKSSRSQIFFYDEKQSIRPSDVPSIDIRSLDASEYHLVSQLRVLGGTEYIDFIENILNTPSLDIKTPLLQEYEFKVYDDISKMISDIKEKNSLYGLSRIVAGYAWEWKSKKNKELYDIEIDGISLKWNSTSKDWVNSKNAINEVGCIHTTQGYDLNYVGVIIGPELSYNPKTNQLVVHSKNYRDANGWRGIEDPEELKQYIVNIYKTLLTRGIRGTYVYIVDDTLREYFKKVINK